MEGLRARGFEAVAVRLPPTRAGVAAPRLARLAAPDIVLGGVSFGGRVASLVAAEAAAAGLLCLAYPLRDQAAERTAHWPRIRCPALVVNGDADPLSDAVKLAALVTQLPAGRLEVVAGAGHDLRPHRDQVLDLAAIFLSTL
ncbi:MAG: hypothetical protein M3024_11530 [Candidatus Dormibacteraeota bacterium]|nr:hypothetical protein [Candidatus Dormibacteraeota bacterium]